MSRRRRPARSRTTPRRTPAAGASPRPAPRAPADPVVAYREAAGYGRIIRVSLLVAVVLLDLPLIVRATGHDAPPIVGAGGIAVMAFFFAAVFLRHLVALHRLRSQHPDLLQPSRRLLVGMLQAPFGIADPRRTVADRVVLRLTVGFGVALLPLVIIAGLANRS